VTAEMNIESQKTVVQAGKEEKVSAGAAK